MCVCVHVHVYVYVCVYVYVYVYMYICTCMCGVHRCAYVIITKIDELDKHIYFLEYTYKNATVDLQVYRRTKYIFGISSFGMNKIYFEKEQSVETQL